MKAIDQYKNVNANSASPHRLIQLLLETYLTRIDESIQAIKNNDVNSKNKAINKAISILGGLEESLNMDDGGDIAENLKSIYTYSRNQVMQACVDGNVDHLIETKNLIITIKEAWDKIPENTP